MAGEIHCPLCTSDSNKLYHRDQKREYLLCTACELVFVPPQYLPSVEDEKAEYDKHENYPDDEGYRHFLSRLAMPLVERVAAGARGLDYGCGPGPALVKMLSESGYDMTLYDPIYFPDTKVLDDCTYDFICATEVVEHMHQPGVDLEKIWSMLGSNGWLGIMTKLVKSPEAFSNWHYKRDPTHVCFFSRATWRWLADRFGADLEFVAEDVILMRRA